MLIALRACWKACGDQARGQRGETSVSGINMLDVNNLVRDMKNVIAVIRARRGMMVKGALREERSSEGCGLHGDHDPGLCRGREARPCPKQCFRTIERHSSAFPWKDEFSCTPPRRGRGRTSWRTAALIPEPYRGQRLARNALVGAHGILLQVRLDIHGRMAEFEIIDNGPGFTQPGTQAAGQSGWGSTEGLGLAFTRRVISLHEALAITSRKDQKRGARVTFITSRSFGPQPSTPDA